MTTATDWLTVSEACSYLRVTRATLYRWARDGKVRLFKISRGTRVRRSDVESLLEPVVYPDLSEDEERWAMLKLAESSFAKDWDNDKDAIYDNWKELYGLQDR
jgi:excisionase family DNA binding protein